MQDNEKKKIVEKSLFRESEKIEGEVIKGYSFNEGTDYPKIIKSFGAMGFQATNLSKAIEIVNKMIDEKAFIYFGYTSNMVSSGLRDVFRYLVEHKKVNVIVTTAGGVEEDIIKCLGDFVLGDFRANGKELREKGINRIGNIYAPNSLYVKFEKFLQPILEEIYLEQEETGRIYTPSDVVWKLGEKINNPKSICYWAWKNKIRIFCPAIIDGAIGDNIYFSLFKNKELKLDLVGDARLMNDTSFGLKKSGVLILGSGVVKHYILNANMLRNGTDYCVYINTAVEFDGSDAGALPEEAVSWGKITKNAESIKVFADATIVFPILVAETFAKENP